MHVVDPARPIVLEVTGLRVVYGRGHVALAGVDLLVADGELLAVLGPNGSGKTTLLRAVTGLLRFHSGSVVAGSVKLKGTDVLRSSPASVVGQGVAQVMEGRRVFPELTVDENLTAGGPRVSSRALAEARTGVHELFPELATQARTRAGLLSGGQQQMLAIGRALMGSPDVLFMDEPFLGLSPRAAERVHSAIGRINAAGTTIVLAEQNAAMGLELAERAYLLRAGAVVAHGRAASLKNSDQLKSAYFEPSAR